MTAGSNDHPANEDPDDTAAHAFHVQPLDPVAAASKPYGKSQNGLSGAARDEALEMVRQAGLVEGELSLGSYFRKLREDANLSVDTLGEELDLPSEAIRSVEAGEPPTALEPERLARWTMRLGAMRRLTAALIRHHAADTRDSRTKPATDDKLEAYLETFSAAFSS